MNLLIACLLMLDGEALKQLSLRNRTLLAVYAAGMIMSACYLGAYMHNTYSPFVSYSSLSMLQKVMLVCAAGLWFLTNQFAFIKLYAKEAVSRWFAAGIQIVFVVVLTFVCGTVSVITETYAWDSYNGGDITWLRLLMKFVEIRDTFGQDELQYRAYYVYVLCLGYPLLALFIPGGSHYAKVEKTLYLRERYSAYTEAGKM